MSYKGIIFDMDGVIVDSNKFHYDGWKAVADAIGVKNYSYEDNASERGAGRREGIKRIASLIQKNLSEKQIDELEELKNNVYINKVNGCNADDLLFGDTVNTLKTLKERGYLIALGSSSKNAKTIIKKTEIEKYFDFVCDATMVKKAKPDPEIFINCVDGLKLKPNEVVVVEDSLNGVIASQRAGIDCIAKDITDTDYPVYSISELNDLLKILG